MKYTFTDRINQHKKAVTAGAAALILILGGGGYALSQAQAKQAAQAQEQAAVKKAQEAKEAAKKEEEAKEKARQALIDAAIELVTYLEKNQETKHVQPAQDAVDKLETGGQKDALKRRIDLVKLNIAHKEEQARLLADANSKVGYLENNQLTEHVQPAQDAVDKLKAGEQKDALQHRIELVKQAIAVREAEAQAQAAAEAQAQAAATQAAQQSAQTYQAPSGNGGGYVAPPADGSGNSNAGGTGPGGTATQDDVNGWAGPDRPKKFNIDD